MTKNIILAIVAVLLVGGGLYFLFAEPMTEEERVVRAFRNTAEIDSYTADTWLNFNVDQGEGEDRFESTLNASMDVDTIAEASRGEGDLNVNIISDGMEVGMSMVGGFVFVDDTLYVKIDELPSGLLEELPLPVEADEQITEFLGEWVMVSDDIEEIDEEVEEFDLDEEELKKVQERLEELLAQLFEREVIFIEDAERDEVNGIMMDKYTFSVNPDRFADFHEEEVIPFFEFVTEEVSGISDEEKEEIMQQLERVGEGLEEMDEEQMQQLVEDMEFVVWTDGNYVHKFRVGMDIDAEDYEEMEDGMLELTMEVTLSNFNEEFDITAPEEYLSLEEVMERMMEGLMDDMAPFSVPEAEEEIDMEDMDQEVDMEDIERQLEDFEHEFEEIPEELPM